MSGVNYRNAIFLVACLGASSPAAAADAAPLAGNAGLASEYRFRGLSQSDFKPAISAGLDYTHSTGLYLGAWGSSISWLSDAGAGGSSVEVDVYGGYKGKAGPVGYDVGVAPSFTPHLRTRPKG